MPVALERDDEPDRLRAHGAAAARPGSRTARPRRCSRPWALERSELPVEHYDNGAQFVYVGLGSVDELAALRPDVCALLELSGLLGVYCFAGEGTHWRSRMFAPGGGVAEDPATGSAAGPLAVHLARHGRIGFGEEIEITQGVEIGRPSTLFARADGTAEQLERVEVGGSAVIVARGEFRLP